jgi:predicted nucleotide-binding protein (sugar kinase/HSP70/actin superfamily)
MAVKNFDSRNFIVISIDSESKLSKKKKKKNLRTTNFWSAYLRCLNINSLVKTSLNSLELLLLL